MSLKNLNSFLFYINALETNEVKEENLKRVINARLCWNGPQTQAPATVEDASHALSMRCAGFLRATNYGDSLI